MKEDFIIIGGVHKAGTTSLYTYLSWHYDVCTSSIKETHFFSNDIYKSKYDEYDKFFKHKKNEHFCVEASPEYLYGKFETAKKISTELENVKIIFVLRNPVEKIISSFNHKKKKLLIKKEIDFKQYAQENFSFKSLKECALSNSGIAKELLEGSYIDYLPDWFEVFDKSNIQIIFFDDLVANTFDVMKKICKFSGIDFKPYHSAQFSIENKSTGYKYKHIHYIAIKLYSLLEPIMRKNYRLKKVVSSIYYKFNSKDKTDNFDEITISKLSNLYVDSNKELKEFLINYKYKDLPDWLLDNENI